MQNASFNIELSEAGRSFNSQLHSKWDKLVCTEFWFSGLPDQFSLIAELLSYTVLESDFDSGVIFITQSGPIWSDVFEGEKSEILRQIKVVVDR